MVVNYAESFGNREASHHFSINKSIIRLWCKNKEALKILPSKKKVKRGLPPSFPNLEKALLEWIIEKRQQSICISCIEIRLKALELKKRFTDAR